MEKLKYIVEDRTIAQLLGVQNFTSDESAILELVKNAYDAKSSQIDLVFSGGQLIVSDSGIGMNNDDIKKYWMHIGKSAKQYSVVDINNRERVLAGSKGVGRFALARLGSEIKLYSKKDGCSGIKWETDWNNSELSEDDSLSEPGTRIEISNLREKWNKKKVENLITFLSKMYNDDAMAINIIHPDIQETVPKYFPKPVLGNNCLSIIKLVYNSENQELHTEINSDEFSTDAIKYCDGIDINHFKRKIKIVDELENNNELNLDKAELEEKLTMLGSFSALFTFAIKSTKLDLEKFLYKYEGLPHDMPGGIILYRNAFSLASFEGKKDWLGFGKRARKSPAAASHPTGAWRVRENQISGKVEIDRERNNVLQDLSNRQGFDENIYYDLFVETILLGIKEFERYRQSIIRKIDVKNVSSIKDYPAPISEKIIKNPQMVTSLSVDEARNLALEIQGFVHENSCIKKEMKDVETRYKYDVQLLNVLATVGLKASSIAHELKNERNFVATSIDYIINALKDYGLWEDLSSQEKTSKAYKNVPQLLEKNRKINNKIYVFMNVMLSEVEKKQFIPANQNISNILDKIKGNWEEDYSWVSIEIVADKELQYIVSEDTLMVVFDNLILNSIQQNDKMSHLNIFIEVNEQNGILLFEYHDNGHGLDQKYVNDPRKILEVHETTRKNGHGLGMWIVNNTVVMSGGEIIQIKAQPGFGIEFSIGGKRHD